MTPAEKALIDLIGDRRVTSTQLVEEGACRTLGIMPNDLSTRLSRLAKIGLLKRITLAPVKKGYRRAQFGQQKAAYAYEKAEVTA